MLDATVCMLSLLNLEPSCTVLLHHHATAKMPHLSGERERERKRGREREYYTTEAASTGVTQSQASFTYFKRLKSHARRSSAEKAGKPST